MELKAESVKNIRSLAFCKELLRQAIELNDQLNEELRHANYKRCFAMANWCFMKLSYHYLVGREEGGQLAKDSFRRSNLYLKWCDRWQRLAEQFKENK